MMRSKFYNQFHRDTSTQYKIIPTNNFTYIRHIEVISKLIHPGDQILDYGCGAGTLALYFGSLGCEVVGIDISEDAIVKAKNSARINNLDKCSFYTLSEGMKNLRQKKFDLIIFSEVLEHLHSDSELLRNLKKNVNKKGKIFISTPSLNAPLFKLGFLKEFDQRVGHLRRYNETTLWSTVEGSGYRVLE